MPLPRNYEKEMIETTTKYRAKCSELNLVNSEMIELEAEAKRRYDEVGVKYNAYQAINTDYSNWKNDVFEKKRKELIELRSEIQAIQTDTLTLCIEFMSREIS